jgi:hypothetical protein
MPPGAGQTIRRMCAIGNSSNTSIGGSATTSTLLGNQAAASGSNGLTPGARRASDGIRGTVLTGGSGLTTGPGGGGGGGGRGPTPTYNIR